MGTSSSSTMDVTCLKPSEYRGDQNTTVAGRIVILKQQEVKPRKAAQVAATPAAEKVKEPKVARQALTWPRRGSWKLIWPQPKA